MKKVYVKLMSVLLAVTLLLGSAPLSGFVGLKFPELNLHEWNWFDLSLKANAKTTDGYYTYYVYNGEAKITDCSTSISGDIIIPSTLEGYPVTSINSNAFYDCKGLTSVTIPNTVTRLEYHAFWKCANLTSVTIPDSVTDIADGVFEFCDNLTTITIGKGVTSIGDDAFYYCNNLLRVYYNGSIDSWCGIDFEDSTSNPLKYAKNFYIDNKLVTEVIIPNTVKSIGSYAFYNYERLTSVKITDSVTYIGFNAFYGCRGLASVMIGKGVDIIGTDAFFDCTALSRVDYNGDIGSWCGITFNNSSSNPIYYTKGFYIDNKLVTEIIIPDSVTKIESHAFRYYEPITSVVISDGVKSIGSYAFNGCSNLTSAVIGNSVTSIDMYAFSSCKGLKELTLPVSARIREHAFSSCINIEKITLTKGTGEMINYEVTFDTSAASYTYTPWYVSGCSTVIIEDGVRNIGENAFYECENLKSITISDTVTNIGEEAFYYCTSLKSVTLGKGVTSISENAFFNCKSLRNVYYGGDIKSWCGITFMNDFSTPMEYAWEFYIDNKPVSEIVIPDTVTEIKNYAFYSFDHITSVKISDSVTKIGMSAFEGCHKLKAITIGKNVTSIEDSAFAYCHSVNSIIIPDGVTSIGNSVFHNCTGLTSIIIPNSVTSIGDTAFSYCSLLTSVVIPDGVIEIGRSAFSYCPKLMSVIIPDSVTSIGAGAFAYCSALTSIRFSNKMTAISGSILKDCSNLKSVIIPASVAEIKASAFSDCNNIETVYYIGSEEQWEEIWIYDGNDCLEKCNKIFIDDSHVHDYKFMITLEPTCTESGVKTYTCYCGNAYTEIMPMLDHAVGNWEVEVEATVSTEGKKVKKCTVCKTIIEEEIIPKLNPADFIGVSIDDVVMNYKEKTTLNTEFGILDGVEYAVLYESTNTDVAMFNNDGEVVAVGPGESIVIVTIVDEFGNKAEDTCTVTVSYAWWQWIVVIVLFGWLWY